FAEARRSRRAVQAQAAQDEQRDRHRHRAEPQIEREPRHSEGDRQPEPVEAQLVAQQPRARDQETIEQEDERGEDLRVAREHSFASLLRPNAQRGRTAMISVATWADTAMSVPIFCQKERSARSGTQIMSPGSICATWRAGTV